MLFGINRSDDLLNRMELVEDYPAKIATMLLNGTIDAGLVPVAILPKMEKKFIISDYCIGADGDVASVCLFSEVPLHETEKVLMDYQSRTSVALCKILLKHFWKMNPVIEGAPKHYRDKIAGTTAGVIIGDRALEQRLKSPYIYDLGGAWKEMTGLPFVFATWVANKVLPKDFITLFNEMNGVGINNIEQVLKNYHFPFYDLKKYYTQNISYVLTPDKIKGMDLFLQMLEKEKL